MLKIKFIPVVVKQIVRHRLRSSLTVAGVAVAMFLFCSIEALQRGTEAATKTTADDTMLVVYRKDRFCPFTSRLPESYTDRIRTIPGVVSAVPVQIAVTNCRTSLDVVVFRGVPEETFESEFASEVKIIDGSLEEWRKRSDAALLGETLANRRRLTVGDRFDALGITVTVAGIIESDDVQMENVAFTHLPFLQRAANRGGFGVVTQFNVRVQSAEKLQAVADAIDEEFRTDREPTQTRAEKAFVARAAGDVLEIVKFTRWLGWGCLAAVLGLVGNAIAIAVQDRVKEHAVLQTLGFRSHLIARLIVAESLLVSLFGGVVGSIAALVFLNWGRFSLSVDGVNIAIATGMSSLLIGLLSSVVLGVTAGLLPAWQASRRSIVECFRMT